MQSRQVQKKKRVISTKSLKSKQPKTLSKKHQSTKSLQLSPTLQLLQHKSNHQQFNSNTSPINVSSTKTKTNPPSLLTPFSTQVRQFSSSSTSHFNHHYQHHYQHQPQSMWEAFSSNHHFKSNSSIFDKKKKKHGDIDIPPIEYPVENPIFKPKPIEIELGDVDSPLGRVGGSNSGVGKEAGKGEVEIDEPPDEEGIAIPNSVNSI
jgi:hypothetical protein